MVQRKKAGGGKTKAKAARAAKKAKPVRVTKAVARKAAKGKAKVAAKPRPQAAGGGERERRMIAELRAENRRLREQLAVLEKGTAGRGPAAPAVGVPTLPLGDGAVQEPELPF
ncbi:MAG: hypothetical protein U0807_03375 [Candidatus Binatia bacterium]